MQFASAKVHMRVRKYMHVVNTLFRIITYMAACITVQSRSTRIPRKANKIGVQCSGDHRYKKRKLSPNRMEAVKKATFAVYPVKPGESREDSWKQYKIAIDTSCRQISRPKKTAKW